MKSLFASLFSPSASASLRARGYLCVMFRSHRDTCRVIDHAAPREWRLVALDDGRKVTAS